jgi:putative adhesin
MKLFASDNRKPVKIISAVFSILIVLTASSFVCAQQKISRRYPVGKNVRFELKNVTGTITVETWQRDEIQVTAISDSRKATFNPRVTESGLVIDIVGDNRGRGDIGDMNFKIQLPARSSVDLETRSGQITVSNVQGDLVRAHIWTSGDIQLSGVSASRVFASNTSGDIFFDGEFVAGGTYEFKSGQGTITLQLPANCGFHLVATSSVKRISMGPFWDERRLQLLGEGRRITGDVGDGRASVTITNYQGDIKFFRR